MLQVNLFKFYRYGYDLRLLRTIKKENILQDELQKLLSARAALIGLLSQQILPRTAKQSAESLVAEIDEIITSDFDESTKIKQSQLYKLRSALDTFETIFAAELSSHSGVYSVPDRGIYDTAHLIEQADHALPELLRGAMSDIARYDLRQSGKCLAFELPTASGFHAFRAVESVVKQYYEKLASKPWPDNELRALGNYIKKLEALKAPKKITDALKQTKDNYRNPLFHPDDTLEVDEALGLFGVVIYLLTMMLQEIVRS